MVSIDQVVALAIGLFAFGLIGAIRRRHAVVVLFGLQLVTIASALAFVGFNRMWAGRALAAGQTATLEGQAFAFVALVVGVVQLLVGMGLALAVVRRRGSADVDDANLLGSACTDDANVLRSARTDDANLLRSASADAAAPAIGEASAATVDGGEG